MSGLGRPDAEQDAQDFRTAHPLRQRRIEAGPTYLDKGKVKSRGEGNRFQVVGDVKRSDGGGADEVVVVSGNCCPIIDHDRLGKLEVGIEVRIFIVDPVSSPEAGVHIEVHQIGEPFLRLIGSGGLAAWQGAELVEIDRSCTLRNQVSVDELKVTYLIISIVVDILVHIPVQNLKSLGVKRVSAHEA